MSNVIAMPTPILTPAGLLAQLDVEDLECITIVTMNKAGTIKAMWSNQATADLALAVLYLSSKVQEDILKLPVPDGVVHG